jgi:hypothetical protein
MDAIFRLTTTLTRDPAVDTWLADPPGLPAFSSPSAVELRALAQQWFARLRRCGADVRERLHDGCPVACIGDAPFAYVNVFKDHVNVGFFYGAELEDPARLLEGAGKRMRHVKLWPAREPDAPDLEALIELSYADIKARLAEAGGVRS